ncbi:hypothetical protein, partial [Nocardioides stalactiti]|uniref:hypothetical protein n=1 Tax=Nocardioides stalactiti TaxID=2755356 RepID=UPI0015FF69E2
TLDDLQQAVVDRDAAAAEALGADDAGRTLLRGVAETAAAMDLTDVTFSYVAENGTVGPDGSWTAAVVVTWRVAGFEEVPARTEVQFEFADGGDRVRSIGGGAAATPVWLSGPTEVRRTDDAVVVVARDALPAGQVLAQAEQALADAAEVLGDDAGSGEGADHLVVEVPATSAALHAALGLPAGTYDAVAAVTTSADGANVPGTPAHVFLNPEVFGALGPIGAQVVMSHEAVHALTDAPTSGAEPWLVEGFADYVALRDVDLPLSRTAGQVIAQVRADGVPASLPSPVDLDSQAAHLGAAYEAAWLACVTLAERGGEAALVRFYDAVLGGADLEEALMTEIGWTVAGLTRAWQDDLEALARD